MNWSNNTFQPTRERTGHRLELCCVTFWQPLRKRLVQ